MSTQMSREGLVWSRKAKALATGLLMAGMMAMGLMAASPAHASTFTVDTSAEGHDANPGDGVCDANPDPVFTTCTMRAALEETNAHSGTDAIGFNMGGTGVRNIAVGSANGFESLGLPTITETVTINGYSQPGSSPSTLSQGTNAKPLVQLDGEGTATTDVGFGLLIDAPNTVVRGIAVENFRSIGIEVLQGGDGAKIEGNFVGTDASGQTDPANHTIAGVVVEGASNVTVGGTTPDRRNLISGNDGDGVLISNSTGSKVLGNLMGTKKDGLSALGNSLNGVRIINASANNSVGDSTVAGANTIAFNGGSGVFIQQQSSQPNSANGNRVSRNSISSNAGLGIDLVINSATGATPNDGDNPNTSQLDPDSDTGPNGFQNFPIITSAKNATTTTVTGKLNSTPGKTFNIQFFSNPSGTDEGKTFIGSKSVTTDASGNATFTFKSAQKVAKGKTITATATDPAGNTSEFSAPKTVALSSGNTLSPETTKLSGPSGITKNPSAHFKFTSTDPQATFECSLDGGAYYGCSSPENVNRLSDGRHILLVRAVDGQGDADPSPAEWTWSVARNK